MTQSESTLATVWLIILKLVECHGFDSEKFRLEAGIEAEALRNVRARVPSRLTDIAFARAVACIPDPAFALRAFECWHPSNLGTMGYAWLSSRTLHTGLKRMVRFSRIIGGDFTYQLVEEAAGVRFIHDHGRGDSPLGHPMADFTLSILVSMCRTNFGRELNPVEVRLRRPQPADPSPWQRLYACPVHFDGKDDSFVIDWKSLESPLPSANIPLANTFDAILTEQMASVFQDDIVSRCKAFLLRELTSGQPPIEAAARDLGLSQRSLQRRLSELKLSYQQILDETRHELARRYLDDPTKSITEIAFLLGFSEQSAFTRAFHRWSGMSPSGYRGTAAS